MLALENPQAGGMIARVSTSNKRQFNVHLPGAASTDQGLALDAEQAFEGARHAGRASHVEGGRVMIGRFQDGNHKPSFSGKARSKT